MRVEFFLAYRPQCIHISETPQDTMATVCHKIYISMGRNFNNILKYNVLSSNFGGYLKLLRVI